MEGTEWKSKFFSEVPHSLTDFKIYNLSEGGFNLL